MAKKKSTKKVNKALAGNDILQATIEAAEKVFGKGVIMDMTAAAKKGVDVISTGSIGLDVATGIAGLPRGRIIEIYGKEAAGKTTLTLHIIANAQKKGLACLFVDAEHALDITYAKKLGVDIDSLLVSQPDYGEQALDIIDMFVRCKQVGLIVVDSVAAMVPKAELDADNEKSHMGLQARMMGGAMRKLTAIVSKSNTTVIFINQMREKIGVVFGPNITTTGGNALKFYASIRIQVAGIGNNKVGDKVVSRRTRATVTKNKLAAPFKQTEFDICSEHGRGIIREGELIDLGIEHGLIEKVGAWLSYKTHRMNGRAKAIEELRENKELAAELQEEIEAAMYVTASEPTKALSADAAVDAVMGKK